MKNIIFVGGFINTIKEYELDLKNNYFKIYHISQKGRDQISLDNNYDFYSQYLWIRNEIEKINIEDFYIFGDSMGSTFAAFYAFNNPKKIKGLIIGDFQPSYDQLNEKWLNKIKSYNTDFCNSDIPQLIQSQSYHINFNDILKNLECPIMYLLSSNKNKINIAPFERTVVKNLKTDDHNFFDSKTENVWEIINEWAN